MAYRKAYVFYLTMTALLWGSMGAVYEVGDAARWQNRAVDYKYWTHHYTFLVGDLLVFNYDPQIHNVVEVSEEQYKACLAVSPLATYNSGSDRIELSTGGDHYFICSFPGMCEDGMKLHIKLPTPTIPMVYSDSSILSFNNQLGLVLLALFFLISYHH